MKDFYKELIIVVVIVAVSLGGLYLYLQRDKQEGFVPSRQVPEVTGPQKGEEGYEEQNTTVEIGTKEVSRGKFVRIEDANLYYTGANGFTVEVPLTQDEIVLGCSTQELGNVDELDYDNFVKIFVFTPNEMAEVIPEGVTIIAFATEVDGTFKVHTIAIDSTKCPAN